MPDDIRVSFLDALNEVFPSLNTNRILQISVVILIIALVGCASGLVVVTGWLNHDASHSFDPSHFHFTLQTFYTETADIFILTVLEVILFPIVAYLAIRSTKQIMHEHYQNAIASSIAAKKPFISCLKKAASAACYVPCYVCDCSKCFYSNKYRQTEQKPSVLSYHLLDSELSMNGNVDNDNDERAGDSFSLLIGSLEGYEAETRRLQQDKKTVDEAYLTIRKTVDYQKSMWLGFLFVLSTAVQVYIGLKCISFNYKNEGRQGPLMGLGVLWTNILTWLLRELIIRMGSEDGLLIPALHPHKLHLSQTLDSHWCDLCGQQIKDSRAFRCKLCDFDLCMICYLKKDAHTLEGQLRGDKGVRQDELLTQKVYMKKALSLVSEEWVILTVALLSLCVYNGVNLWTPSLQGTILNSVVEGDYSSFNYWIRLYLFASIGIGVIGGIQSLCFNIVGRKLANTIRKRLFKGIIVQDIAFLMAILLDN
jgi:uncharacterized membrane protein